MIIDHICFAVKSLPEAIDYWDKIFGYIQKTEIVLNTANKVKVVFLEKEGSIIIKLIEPLDENKSLMNFVLRGGGFHHLCFKCSDIHEQFKGLSDKGLLPLFAPQPGEAFNNKNIAFLLAKYNLNVELIDTNEKAGLLH
jgi:methylmalonyl-CoA/ethylmalonyl-CoA epimerase